MQLLSTVLHVLPTQFCVTLLEVSRMAPEKILPAFFMYRFYVCLFFFGTGIKIYIRVLQAVCYKWFIHNGFSIDILRDVVRHGCNT